MKKIHIKTFGCKVNQYESASFQSSFEESGHQIISSGADSDIIVINTCAVTGKAGAQSRQTIRKAARENPDARIVVTGCYAEVATNELQQLDELKNHPFTIVGNADKHLLVDAALRERPETLALQSPIDKSTLISPLPTRGSGRKTRAYLRIQDGCNAFCSYCIVPHTRGRSRSLELREVIRQAMIYKEEGYREVVITGIHVGYYGQDLSGNISLETAVAELCAATPDIRYRLSSIEPLEITPGLLRIMVENDNFMPHLHIPLQSGANDILLRMNRRYTTDEFADITAHCRKEIEDVAIGIDILAGFPGETEELFEQTFSFLEQLDFTYLHVFPYSRRPGTPAAEFENQIPKNIKNERVAKLRKLGDTKKHLFYNRFAGTVRKMLIEGSRDADGYLKGFTDNYIPVVLEGDDSFKNSIVKVRLLSEKNHAMLGTMTVGEDEG